jgi:hypothetical protein
MLYAFDAQSHNLSAFFQRTYLVAQDRLEGFREPSPKPQQQHGKTYVH